MLKHRLHIHRQKWINSSLYSETYTILKEHHTITDNCKIATIYNKRNLTNANMPKFKKTQTEPSDTYKKKKEMNTFMVSSMK